MAGRQGHRQGPRPGSLVDDGGTPTDPFDDGELEFVGVVEESTGRIEDFCADAVPVLMGLRVSRTDSGRSHDTSRGNVSVGNAARVAKPEDLCIIFAQLGEDQAAIVVGDFWTVRPDSVEVARRVASETGGPSAGRGLLAVPIC
jgi:hypothetical protein